MKYSPLLVVVVVVASLQSTATCFKELNDGARIDRSKSLESYSIPLRSQRASNAGVGDRVAGVLSRFDDDEYNLISRMKTMETPPSPDAIDHYAANKHVSSRFTTQSRTKRELKFDGQSIRPPMSEKQVQFGADSSEKNKDGDKRIFPELFGIGGPGYYGGGPYNYHGSHHPPPHYNNHHGGYYPGGGAYYPPHHGGAYGNGYYPGAYQPYYPGGNGGSSSAASAAASSSSGGRPGLYGGHHNGYYGNGGYLPNGGVAPILSPAYGGYPGGGFLGGFFRDEDGKGGSGAVAGGSGDRVKGSVSFEK